MTDTIRSAIQQVYAAFADAKRPSQIPCSPVKDERDYHAITHVSLRQLTAEQVASYAFSVFYTVGSMEDFEYVFPRLIELATEDFTSLEREVLFKKPNLAGWPNWRKDRQKAFQDYLDAMVAAFGVRRWPDEAELDSWICSLSFCLDDLDARLDVLLSGSEAANHNLILFHKANSVALFKNRLSNSFWERADDLHSRIVRWFGRDDVVKKLANVYDVTSQV